MQDTYLKGPNYHVPYSEFVDGWRAFDRIWLIVYPADRESEVRASENRSRATDEAES